MSKTTQAYKEIFGGKEHIPSHYTRGEIDPKKRPVRYKMSKAESVYREAIALYLLSLPPEHFDKIAQRLDHMRDGLNNMGRKGVAELYVAVLSYQLSKKP